MDEPLGTLDTELREVMVRELRELHNRIGATTVYVTHDQMEAMAMADKIAVMNHGVIEQFGTPQQIYARPASMYVADFIGAPPMNFVRFEGSAAAGADTVTVDGRPVRVPRLAEDTPGPALALGVRPEHIRFDADGRAPGQRLRRRVPRHQPDRHHRHRPRPAQGPDPGRRPDRAWRDRGPRPRQRPALALRRDDRPGDPERAPWLRSSSPGSRRRSARPGPSPTCR